MPLKAPDTIKQQLKEAEKIIKKMDVPNAISDIIGTTTFDLFDILSTMPSGGKELVIDEDTQRLIDNIAKRLPQLLVDAQKKIRDYDDQLDRGWLSWAAEKGIRDKADHLYEITGDTGIIRKKILEPGVWSVEYDERKKEYEELKKFSDHFNTRGKFPDNKITLPPGYPTPPNWAKATTPTIDIDNTNFLNGAAPQPTECRLCDDQGNPLTKKGAKYTVTTKDAAGTAKTIEMEVPAGADIIENIWWQRRLNLTDVVFTPPLSGNLTIDLSIMARYDTGVGGIAWVSNTGIQTVHTKPFKIEIIDNNKLDALGRWLAVDAYNNTPAGSAQVKTKLNAIYQKDLAKMQKETIFEALKHVDGKRFDELLAYGREFGREEEIKDALYEQIFKEFLDTGKAREAPVKAINTYHIFRNRFAHDDRARNKDVANIKDANTYKYYLHNNISTGVTEYIQDKLNDIFVKDHTKNIRLKTELNTFLTNVEKEKKDTDVHMDVDNDIGKEDKMENRRRFGIIWRKDINYLRFFSGGDSKISIPGQVVHIETNTKGIDLKNAEPVKYSMDMEVAGKQQIAVNIKIEGEKEIPLQAGDIASLARKVLRHYDIKHGKTRAHIVYNILKGMIEMAKKKNISLNYYDDDAKKNRKIVMREKDIVVEEHDETGAIYKKEPVVVFDYGLFEASNAFDSGPQENRKLRVGIDKIMAHFNIAMEKVHEQYRDATERKRLGLRRGSTRMTLPNSFRLSPLKKILNFRTKTKFDFTTSVQTNGKTVSIGFKKNEFTLNVEGLKKPIKSRTLGKLLRHRQGGIRVFDGMERDICGQIYKTLIEDLRKNSKIARTSFGFEDSTTGRTYILDENGKFGYVTKEFMERPENKKLIRRGAISKRKYGIIKNPPLARQMCDAETIEELYRNPFLMGRLIKTMNNRMGLISSARETFS